MSIEMISEMHNSTFKFLTVMNINIRVLYPRTMNAMARLVKPETGRAILLTQVGDVTIVK